MELNEIKQQFQQFINTEHIQLELQQKEFKFKLLQDAFNVFEETKYSSVQKKIEDVLLNINTTKFSFQLLLDKYHSTEFGDFLLLIGKLISMLDEKAYNKHIYNPYPDKRVISRSNFSQKSWLICFLLYKKEENSYNALIDKGDKAFINSIEYIKKPIQRLPISSDNHRQMLFDFFKVSSDEEIIGIFDDEINAITNTENKSLLLTYFLYSKNIQKKWLITVKALLIADGTGWQDGHIKIAKKSKFNILWNSKRPSGTNDTISKLNERLNEEGFFHLYYSSRGIVKYRAKIIDFATNEIEYGKKNWSSFTSIYGFEEFFEDYKDHNKSASIVFLAENIEEVEPIPIDQFVCFKNFKLPTQDNITPISDIRSEVVTIRKSYNMTKQPLNQILYGPPGTGKTYSTIDKVVEICDADYLEGNHIHNKTIYDQLVKEGRVVFTTFHQSLAYEDFIEGIKPLTVDSKVQYDIQDGIFKKLCESATDSIKEFIVERKKSTLSAPTLSFEQKYKLFVQAIQQGKINVTTKTGIDVQLTHVSGNGNMRLTTGASALGYIISSNRLKKLVINIPDPSSLQNIHDDIREVIGGANASLYYAALVAFSEFNTTLTNEIDEVGTDVSVSEIILSKEDISEIPKYVIVIDEINRGNVSAIFGELITLIEEDKRLFSENALSVDLVYSKGEPEKFIVPPNLYILGTMNTADRSVEALDTALRRRFSFVEMLPNPDLIATEGKSKASSGKIGEIDIVELLTTINDRIEVLVDRDHTIGHAFFMNVNSIEDLRSTFAKNIIPLLQEYFYGNYEKMEMVIGPWFFEQEPEKKNINEIFAVANQNFDLPERQLKLKNVAKMPITKFSDAVMRLLDKSYQSQNSDEKN